MNRRDLIAGAATLAGSSVFASALGSVADADAADALTIGSSLLEVAFDAKRGLPTTYSFQGQRLRGEDGSGNAGEPVRAIVCRLAPRSYETVALTAATVQHTPGGATFGFKAEAGGREAASFALRYAVEGASLRVTLESVQEQAGFELIEVALPQLVTVREEDGPAWMAEGRRGGSFVWLEQAKAFRFPDNDYFGRISTELPIGMVGQNGIGCVMEVTAYMDATETEITGSAGRRRATLGTVLVHRVHGGRCYNMNDGGPMVCGNANTPNLMVGQMPLTRFDFFACADQAQPWLEGAKVVRGRAPMSPTGFFSDRFLYILHGKDKVEATPKTTFAQSRALVHDVALLTDNAPQTVFLSGWVYDGQDTGYPSEDKINSSLGDYAELRELMETSKQWNANVTLNVNYDDAYRSSPIFDEAFIARRPDGEIWKSRAWDGEDSYVVGMAKFVEGGWAERRIDYTMSRYRIKDAMLIDAMSWFAVRNDWDPRHPASGYKNLVDGKYKIVEAFRKRGIAVTSEQMRFPFMGKLALSMDGPEVSDCPFGGESVPLVSTVFRKTAIWGTVGGRNEPMQQLFWNTRSVLWFQADSDRMKMAEFYYLVVLPYSKLHTLAVEGYESSGSARRVVLEQNSMVRIDTASETYTAVVNGVEIAKDNATFCPIDGNRVAFYSRTARRLRAPLPAGWDASAVTARSLTLTGRMEHPVRVAEGMVEVDVQGRQPVIVYARESAIARA